MPRMPQVCSACSECMGSSKKGSHVARSATRSSWYARYAASPLKLPRPSRASDGGARPWNSIVAACFSAKLIGTPSGCGRPGPTGPLAVKLMVTIGMPVFSACL